MVVSNTQRRVGFLPGTHHRQYDSSIVVPELMHNPHAGHDAKEEKDEDDYEESDGEAEDGRPPVALVAGHFLRATYWLFPGVKGVLESLASDTCWRKRREERRGERRGEETGLDALVITADSQEGALVV